MEQIENGTRVTINASESFANADWGIVRHFDGDYYHVALAGGEEALVFAREELVVSKNSTISTARANFPKVLLVGQLRQAEEVVCLDEKTYITVLALKAELASKGIEPLAKILKGWGS